MRSTPAQDSQLALIYRRYVTMIRERTRRMLGDTGLAEDVTQEVFILLIDQIRTGTPVREPAAFLYRAATTRALNVLRDRKRRAALLEREGPLPELAGDGEDRDARLDLARVLAAVDEELASVAVYYYVDGMDQDEIGTLLGLHRRTVSRRLEEFRERAQRVMTPRGASA